MHVAIVFVLKRMLATEAFQTLMAATWVWAKKTVAQWGTDRAALLAKQEALVSLEREVITNRATMDNAVQSLHEDTSQALGMMRGFYRDNPVILSQLTSLSASGQRKSAILKQALDLQSQWE